MFKAIGDIIGKAMRSRLMMAVWGAFFITFATYAVFHPGKWPPVGVPPLVQLGLVAQPAIPAPEVKLPDFIDANTRAMILAEAKKQIDAKAPEVKREVWDFAVQHYAENPTHIQPTNGAIAGFFLLLLLISMWLQVRVLREDDAAGLRQDVYAFGKIG